MKITAALTLLLALASSTSFVHAQEAAGEGKPSPFTYRYTKTVIHDPGKGPVVVPPVDPEEPEEPEEPEDPPEACGTFTITDGFAASSQSLDGNGDCVFDAPKYGAQTIGFDYTTAEAFCASTMNGGGRIAKITKLSGAGNRSVRANGSQVSSSFQIPGISEITCSTASSICNNGEFQDGATCLPKTNLSCGRLKNDPNHYLPAGGQIEMASIGQCTFQIPQVTIVQQAPVSIMGEGQTMEKWVSTLRPNGYNDFDAFISAYSLSPTTDVDYAHWKANSNTPNIPRIAYKMVDYITIADTGYGTPATLPGNLVATPIASGGQNMNPTTTVTIRFTPEAAADGLSQIADIDLYDVAGNQIDIISSTLKSDSGNTASTSLIDYNGSTTETFITPSNDSTSRPRAVTLVFSNASLIGSIALRAAASNDKFPYSFAVYATADANDNTPLFYAGTRQYTQSVKVQGGQWTRILNPVYNQ